MSVNTLGFDLRKLYNLFKPYSVPSPDLNVNLRSGTAVGNPELTRLAARPEWTMYAYFSLPTLDFSNYETPRKKRFLVKTYKEALSLFLGRDYPLMINDVLVRVQVFGIEVDKTVKDHCRAVMLLTVKNDGPHIPKNVDIVLPSQGDSDN